MVDPKKIITFPRGKFITTETAAEILNIGLRRVRQLIEDEQLSAFQLEEKGNHYIPLSDFEKFASKPRPVGRPSTKKARAKSARKPGKK